MTLSERIERLVALLPQDHVAVEGHDLGYPELSLVWDCDNDGVYEWEVEFMALDAALNYGSRRPSLEAALDATLAHVERVLSERKTVTEEARRGIEGCVG